MGSIFDKECLEFYDRRKMASVEELGKELRVENESEKEIAVYRVDGCLIQQNQCCDYLLLIIEDKCAYFIKLKGSHIEKAIKQLNASIDKFYPKLSTYKINAWIISSKARTPALRSSHMIKLKQRLKKLKGSLHIETRRAFFRV